MGTRADFWLGHGPDAEWLGSVAINGYEWHEDPKSSLKKSTTPEDFKDAVAMALKGRLDATVPADGWPWPWRDSNTTDFAYVFDEGRVHIYCFGRPVDVKDAESRLDWRDMSAVKNVTLGPRSGLIVIGVPR